MGKNKSFIVLGIAVIVALIVSLLIYNWLQQKGRAKEATVETQIVCVSAADLPWGTVLSDRMVKRVPFFKASLPVGYFSDPSSLTGRVIIYPVKTNEPILESKLAPISVRTGGVAAVITAKKRAIAVKVDKTIGVSGFIFPGNRVDVLVTLPQGKNPTPITKIVLENLLVLAAGPEIESKGKEQKPATVDVITLEVTPEEAEKLGLAATEGKLLLALRNFTDTADVLTQGTTIPALLASYSSGPPKVAMAATRRGTAGRKPVPAKMTQPAMKQPEPGKEKPPPFVVELIKGNKVSEVKFEGTEQ